MLVKMKIYENAFFDASFGTDHWLNRLLLKLIMVTAMKLLL